MSKFHALIRTHHITSRKKVAELRAAAKDLHCLVLLRSGGVPGMMYVSGSDQRNVQAWVDVVHRLRYKDYKLVVGPEAVPNDDIKDGKIKKKKQAPDAEDANEDDIAGSLEEVAEVKDFGQAMEAKSLWHWWRAAMGFAKDD